MELQQAIELLENYNKWRRGAEIPQPNPTEIGVAISVVLEYTKNGKDNTEFENAVKKMRVLQKAYFAGRDRQILERSKAAERLVDSILNEKTENKINPKLF